PWVLLVLLGLAAMVTLLIPHPHVPAVEEGADPHLLSRPGVRWFLLAGVLMQFSHSGYYGFFSLHLEANGFSPTAIGGLWTLGVAAEVLVMARSARLLQTLGVSALLWGSLALAALRWGIFASTLWLPLLLLGQVLHAFTFAAFHVGAVRRNHDIAAPGQRAAAQAWYSALSFGIGGGVGGVVSGLLYDALGAGAVYGCMSVAAALGVLASRRGCRHLAGESARRTAAEDHP
ncbi:MAG: MFS transporter, partial [Magnetococcus sp. WYHC-3]